MCLAMEIYTKKTKVEGAIDMLRDLNMDDETIIERIINKYDLDRDEAEAYVLPKPVEAV